MYYLFPRSVFVLAWSNVWISTSTPRKPMALTYFWKKNNLRWITRSIQFVRDIVQLFFPARFVQNPNLLLYIWLRTFISPYQFSKMGIFGFGSIYVWKREAVSGIQIWFCSSWSARHPFCPKNHHQNAQDRILWLKFSWSGASLPTWKIYT